MKNETIKVNDTVFWIECPQIKSKVKEIKKSRFSNIDLYICANGYHFQRFEIEKDES